VGQRAPRVDLLMSAACVPRERSILAAGFRSLKPIESVGVQASAWQHTVTRSVSEETADSPSLTRRVTFARGLKLEIQRLIRRQSSWRLIVGSEARSCGLRRMPSCSAAASARVSTFRPPSLHRESS
jgi:hypothetical protein